MKFNSPLVAGRLALSIAEVSRIMEGIGVGKF